MSSAPARCSTTTASASGWSRSTATGRSTRSPGRWSSSCSGSSVCWRTEPPQQVVEKRALALHELGPGHLDRPPRGAVDLRELGRLAAPWRPLHREGAGHDRGRVEVRLRGPDRQPLPARLPELTQWTQVGEVDRERETELLRELPSRGREWFLGVVVQTLRDGPAGLVLVRPERAAHVTQQHLEAARDVTVEQDSGTPLDHGRQPSLGRCAASPPPSSCWRTHASGPRRSCPRSGCTCPTTPWSCGRPRSSRSSVATCRRRSGPSSGPADKQSPATSSTTMSPPVATSSTSPPGPGSSPSPPPMPVPAP